MTTLRELESKLSFATQHNIIRSYEHTPNDCLISIRLKEGVSEETKQLLKEHIKSRYKFVDWIIFGDHKRQDMMFVKYMIRYTVSGDPY